jgi:hypothetical protein
MDMINSFLRKISVYTHRTYDVEFDRRLKKCHCEGYCSCNERGEVPVEKANTISSEVTGFVDFPGLPYVEGRHTIMLDIDVPAILVPSTTKGHSHLYIDRHITWEQYEELLHALAKVGIIELGFAEVSIARKATFLRLPWVRKQEGEKA